MLWFECNLARLIDCYLSWQFASLLHLIGLLLNLITYWPIVTFRIDFSDLRIIVLLLELWFSWLIDRFSKVRFELRQGSRVFACKLIEKKLLSLHDLFSRHLVYCFYVFFVDTCILKTCFCEVAGLNLTEWSQCLGLMIIHFETCWERFFCFLNFSGLSWNNLASLLQRKQTLFLLRHRRAFYRCLQWLSFLDAHKHRIFLDHRIHCNSLLLLTHVDNSSTRFSTIHEFFLKFFHRLSP